MRCWVCEEDKAYIRECELEVAAISGKAHVDCLNGHSCYAWICKAHIAESKAYYEQQKKEQACKNS